MWIFLHLRSMTKYIITFSYIFYCYLVVCLLTTPKFLTYFMLIVPLTCKWIHSIYTEVMGNAAVLHSTKGHKLSQSEWALLITITLWVLGYVARTHYVLVTKHIYQKKSSFFLLESITLVDWQTVPKISCYPAGYIGSIWATELTMPGNACELQG